MGAKGKTGYSCTHVMVGDTIITKSHRWYKVCEHPERGFTTFKAKGITSNRATDIPYSSIKEIIRSHDAERAEP